MIRILNLLVPVAEMVFRGPTAKAKAGATVGSILMAGPLLEAFQNGLINGAGGSVEEFGYAIGQIVIGGVLGWVLTWLPANKEKTDK